MNSDYIGLHFSEIFIFVTLLKDDVNSVSYVITEYRFGAACIGEYLRLFFLGIFVMTWMNQPFWKGELALSTW